MEEEERGREKVEGSERIARKKIVKGDYGRIKDEGK